MSDEELYRHYLSLKDNNALKTLLERHREELVFFLYRILKDMEDAEDIMLDAYAVAASGTSKFSEKSSFKTWLFAIGREELIDYRRK
jgi:RNA polymerase sigma-70 factor (ECF subfamily)